MPTVYDVPAEAVIRKLADHLKEASDIVPPKWVAFVKTGSHVERPPQNPNWWYTRCASIFRKIYFKGPIGVSRLRSEYGGRARRGSSPAHSRDGGGSIIRNALQQLEKAGYLMILEKKGRTLTSEGRSLLDRLSGQVKREKR